MIKGWHNHSLARAMQYINLLGFFVGIILLCLNFSWLYFTAMIIAIVCISKIGHSIGQHRYFCHLAFKVNPVMDWFIALCVTLSTTHSIIYYAAVHRYHHLHSDKDEDLHSPKHLGFWRTFFLKMDSDKLKKIPNRIIKDLLSRESVMFFHNWYWPTIALYILLLGLIDPWLILYCYVVPSGYSKFISGIQLSAVHMWGYRNFETSDNSTNSIFWNWVTLGEGLHNNHHARPGEYDFSFTKKPGEWDFAGWLIKLIKNP
jgi:stearoyl-CoA desaturase (delta-9 desaturase)